MGKKKATAVFAMIAFAVFSWSCTAYTPVRMNLDEINKMDIREDKVVGLVKKSGEEVKFSKKNPLYMDNDYFWVALRLNRNDI